MKNTTIRILILCYPLFILLAFLLLAIPSVITNILTLIWLFLMMLLFIKLLNEFNRIEKEDNHE
jgi:hypothetical protein